MEKLKFIYTKQKIHRKTYIKYYPRSYHNSLLLLCLLFAFDISTIVLSFKRCLELVTASPISSDEVSKLLNILVLILHRAVIERERPNEFLDCERPDSLLFKSVVREYFLASDSNASCRVTMGDVSERAQRKFWLDHSTYLFNEVLPH